MTPDNFVEKVLDINLTRRQVLELGADLALIMTALPDLETKERQSKIQFLASVEKFNLTETDAAKLIELEYNRPIEPSLTFRELKLKENLNGYLTPEIHFETQGLKEQVDYALGWINDLREEGADLGLEILFDYDGVNPPKEAAVIMRAKSNFKWGERDVRAGSPVIIRKNKDEDFGLHFIEQSNYLPGSEIKIIKLDEYTDSQLKARYQELGYGELITKGAGSWIMAELDREGNIVQIITEGEAVSLTKKVFVGQVELNVRSEPNPSNDQNIITQILDANTSIVTPTALPPELPGNVDPRDVSVGIYKEDEALVTQANGYTWYLVQYSDGRYGWSALDVKNPDTVNVAAGPQIPRESIFRSIDEINYFDFGDKPWERYGITEEEYRQTKETVTEYTPQEVIDEAEGRYSHELRGYVKLIDGKTFVWRPGMGKDIESGWVTEMGRKFVPDEMGGYEIILQGNPKNLKDRKIYDYPDISTLIFSNNPEVYRLLAEGISNYKFGFRTVDKNFKLYIQIGSDNYTDVYTPTSVYQDQVQTGYKYQYFKDQDFAFGRILCTVKGQLGNEMVESALSENFILILISLHYNEHGNFVKFSERHLGRFSSSVESVMSYVLGPGKTSPYYRQTGIGIDVIRERVLLALN